jgi:hypothetical protein
MLKYAAALMDIPWDENGARVLSDEEYARDNQTIAQYLRRVIDDCADDALRYEAIDLLSCHYRGVDPLKAIELARRLPSIGATREDMLFLAYDELEDHREARADQLQANLERYGSWLGLYIRFSAWAQGDDAVKIALFQKALALGDLIYDDGNYGFELNDRSRLHESIGFCRLRLGDAEGALESFRSAADFAARYDALPEEVHYTAVLVSRRVYKKRKASHGYEGKYAGQLLKRLGGDACAPLTADARFQALLQTLRDCGAE